MGNKKGLSDEEIRRKAEEFARNAVNGDDAANDQLVRDLDPRQPHTVDGERVR